MLLTRYEPANLFDQFNNEVNRFFNNTRAADVATHDWVPAVDISEETHRYILKADLPGIDRKDVDISLENDILTIKGERVSETDKEQEGYRRKERLHGTFLRRFSLPDTADVHKISAVMKDGVLVIEIPKQTKVEPLKIAVK